MEYNREDLKNMTMGDLNKIAAQLEIKGRSKMKTLAFKDELIKLIMKDAPSCEAPRVSPKRVSPRTSPRASPRTSPRAASPRSAKLKCGMGKTECMKTEGKGGYSVLQIKNLALRCGIDPTGMKRGELCEAISKYVSSGGVPAPASAPSPKASKKPKKTSPSGIPVNLSCGMDENDCNKTPAQGGHTIGVIKELAKKCNIENISKKTKKQLCQEISRYIETVVPPFMPPPPSMPMPPPPPVFVDEFGDVMPPPPAYPAPMPDFIPPPAYPFEFSTEKCYNNTTREQLLKKRIEELKAMLANENILADNIPSDQPKIVDYLCDVGKEKMCDPAKNMYCPDDMYCDVEKNACVSPSSADFLKNVKGVETFEYNGKKIIGSAAAINALKARLPPPVIPPPFMPMPIPMPRPPEGTPIEVVDDIENLLNMLQGEPTDRMSDLTAVQREVLKCLGLVGV